MSQIAVIFWSGTGNTERMENAIAAGVQSAGNTAQLFSVSDFSEDKIDAFSSFALGCPAMGSEELEDSEFLPFYNAIKEKLAGKAVALFRSYGWGGGEWLNAWKADAEASGLKIIGTLAIENAPDENGIAECEALGKKLT